MAEETLDRVDVLGDIRQLTAAPAPALEQVERTLADGYACALGIEAERIRLQRELEGRAARLSNRTGSKVDEVAALARGIARADEELIELRAALVELARTARRLRTSYPA
jgi:predicted kinase